MSRRKSDSGQLSTEEIRSLISDDTRGKIPVSQMSARRMQHSNLPVWLDEATRLVETAFRIAPEPESLRPRTPVHRVAGA